MKPIFVCLLFFCSYSYSQELYDPDTILIDQQGQPEILLVGAYHFAYYNYDAHKTEKDKQVDVLSLQRQIEMDELTTYIAQFKPTKIAVESFQNTSKLLESYHNYLKTGEMGRDEQEQIGFRLMKQFKLDTIYGVDDISIANEMFDSKDTAISHFAIRTFDGYDFRTNDPISKRYTQLYQIEDSLKLQTTLLEYFRHLNTDKMLSRGFGAYLNGDFDLENHHGADAMAMYWYNRNLRIYRNIEQIATSNKDRIVVIFGSAHIQILKQLFESSPEFKLTKFNELEQK